MCERFTEITGGPTIQSYDEATKTARFGSLMDWAYNQHGIYGWVPELWDVWKAAGIDRGDSEEYFGSRDEDDQAALLAWNDRELGGKGFIDWHPSDHPRLGQVEIGGWTYKFTHQNPPGAYIPAIAAAHIEWTDYLASQLPRLEIAPIAIEDLGENVFRVSAEVANRSFLPTNISQQAIDVRRADPVHVELRLEAGTVLDGQTRTVGHLAGRGSAGQRIWEEPRPDGNAATVSWIVRGKPIGNVVAWSARAGRAEVRIGTSG
jgi:hypothetical protein